ncbi:hypothetical protein RCL1_002787 [Eukaryota sp. TZLM3-RCL]
MQRQPSLAKLSRTASTFFSPSSIKIESATPPDLVLGLSSPQLSALNNDIFAISSNHLLSKSSPSSPFSRFFSSPNSSFSAFSVSQASSVIALADLSTPPLIYMIQYPSATPIRILHTSIMSEIIALAFSPSADVLVALTASPNPSLVVFHTQTSRELTSFSLPDFLPCSSASPLSWINNTLSFCPSDPSIFAVIGLSSVFVFKLLQGVSENFLTQIHSLLLDESSFMASSCCWTAQSNLMVSSQCGSVYLIDLNSGDFQRFSLPLVELIDDGESHNHDFITSLIALENSYLFTCYSGIVGQFSILTSQEVSITDYELTRGSPIISSCVSQNFDQLFALTYTGHCEIFNLNIDESSKVALFDRLHPCFVSLPSNCLFSNSVKNNSKILVGSRDTVTPQQVKSRINNAKESIILQGFVDDDDLLSSTTILSLINVDNNSLDCTNQILINDLITSSSSDFSSNVILLGSSGTVYWLTINDSNELLITSSIRIFQSFSSFLSFNFDTLSGIVACDETLAFIKFKPNFGLECLGFLPINSSINCCTWSRNFKDILFIGQSNGDVMRLTFPNQINSKINDIFDLSEAINVISFTPSQLSTVFIHLISPPTGFYSIKSAHNSTEELLIALENGTLSHFEIPKQMLIPIDTITSPKSVLWSSDSQSIKNLIGGVGNGKESLLIAQMIDGSMMTFKLSSSGLLSTIIHSTIPTFDIISGNQSNFDCGQNKMIVSHGNGSCFVYNVNYSSQSNFVIKKSIIFDRAHLLSSDPFNDKTFVELIVAHNSEERSRKTEVIKSKARAELSHFESRFQSIVAENFNYDPEDQLPESEFLIDTQHVTEVKNRAVGQVEKVKIMIEREIVKNTFLTDRIKNKYFDHFKIKPEYLRSFPPNDYTISNYSITPLKISPEDEQNFEKMIESRKISLNFNSIDFTEIAPNSLEKFFLAVLWNSSCPHAFLLYPQHELTTIEKRNLQKYLLQQVELYEKEKFNEIFEEVRKEKKKVVGSLIGAIERLEELVKEGNTTLDQLISTDDLSILTRLDKQSLSVADFSEQVEGHINRSKKSSSFNSDSLLDSELFEKYSRGLVCMMDGQLDRPTTSVATIELTPPEFSIKISKNDWSAEQKAEYDSYLFKVKELETEKQKMRKNLEIEAKRIVDMVSDLMTSFNQKMIGLESRKVLTQHLISDIFLMISTLDSLDYKLSRDENLIEKLNNLVQNLENEHPLMENQINLLESQLQKLNEKFDELTGLDRNIGSKFKSKDLPEDIGPLLSKTFKNRPKIFPEILKPPLAPHPPSEGIHFNASLPIQEHLSNIDSCRPEEVPENLWQNFMNNLKKKYYMEFELYTLSKEIAGTKRNLSNFQAKISTIDKKFQDSAQKYQKLRDNFSKKSSDLSILFRLRQGQIELPIGPLIYDFSKGQIIGLEIIDVINQKIVEAGQKSLKLLEKMISYRRNIQLLYWQLSKTDMEIEDVNDEIHDFQLLRVTKKIQSILTAQNSGKSETSEIASVHRNKQHAEKLFKKKSQEVKRAMAKIDQQLRDTMIENHTLTQQVEELELEVERLNELTLSNTNDSEDFNITMKQVRTVRTLSDNVSLKQTQLEILREELERLKQRTFPSFMVNEYVHPDVKQDFY